MRENIEDEAEEAREVLMPQTGVQDYGALSPTQENRGRRM